MSKISLSGDPLGTGTFTIASPNSNSNYTLNLPTATGTINTSGAVNEVPAGSASAPSIYPTGDTNTGIFFPAADTIAFTEGGTESMRIDSSGNVGIGTSSPGYKLVVSDGTRAGIMTPRSTAAGGLAVGTDVVSSGHVLNLAGDYVGGGTGGGVNVSYYSSTTGNWAAALSIRNTTSAYGNLLLMQDGGNLLVGTTSQLSGSGATISTSGRSTSCTVNIQAHNGAGYDPIIYLEAPGVLGSYVWTSRANAQLRLSAGSQTNGVSLASGGTSWGTFSDERLKTDLAPIENAAQKVSTLRAVTGRYKTDREDTRRAFLIAQDVKEVLPEAVYQNSAEDDTLSLAYTDTIPLLVAAIKELKTELDSVKAELAALKGA